MGLNPVAPFDYQVNILHFPPENVGHWDLHTTRKVITERFWFPTIQTNVTRYVRSFYRFQRMKLVTKYVSNMYRPLTNLFEVLSINFSGSFRSSSKGNNVILICVKDLTCWPVAEATHNFTADTVVKFVEEQILH